MDITPTWQTPHYFTQLDVSGHGMRLQHVHTYGLLSLEIAEADLSTGFPDRLVSRVGYEWLASLYERLREEHPRRSKLTQFVRDEVGIARPGDPSAKAIVGLPHARALHAELVATFVEEALGPIRELVDLEIHPLTFELFAAAEDRRRPDAEISAGPLDHAFESAKRLQEIYSPRLELLGLRSTDGRSLGLALGFESLAARMAMEIFQLYKDPPVLRRCRLCNRVFVPRERGDKLCRSLLWRSGEQDAFELCLPGDPKDVAAAYSAGDIPLEDHQRTRKRLHQQWRRELSRARGDATSKRVLLARKRYDEWMKEHGRARGPQPRPVSKKDDIAVPVRPREEKR